MRTLPRLPHSLSLIHTVLLKNMPEDTCAHGGAGVVNGMQSSLQSLLQALRLAVGLVIWQPQLFVFLMAGSVLVVSAALVVYLYFIGAKKWLEERIRSRSQSQPMQGFAQAEQACELAGQTDSPEK